MGGTIGLLVLGMHRSGTSALARVLALGGADLGARVLGASAGNEAGHWEDAFAVETHERLLNSLGGRWDEPFLTNPDAPGQPVVLDARARIRAYLESDRAAHPLWAVKDPRLCQFADLWKGAAADIGIPLAGVLVLRHPYEVAASLEARDGIGAGHASLLWLDSMASAASALEDMPHVVVGYDELLRDWRATISRIEATGVPLHYPQKAVAAVTKFLDPALKHQRIHADAALPSVVEEVWQYLVDAQQLTRLPAGAGNRLQAAVRPVRQLLQPYAREERVTRQALWERVARAEATALASVSDQSAIALEISELRERTDHHRNDLVELLSEDIRRMQAAAADALERAAQAQGRLSAANAIEALPDEVRALQERLESHRSALTSLFSEDIRRMQQVAADALAQMAASQREANIAADVAPRIESAVEALHKESAELRERMDRHSESMISLFSEDIRRMQQVAAEALAEVAASQREANIAADVAPRIESAVEALHKESAELRERMDRHSESMISLFSEDIRRMQQVAAEALAEVAASQREASIAADVVPRIESAVEASRAAAEALQASLDGHVRSLRDLINQEAQVLKEFSEAAVDRVVEQGNQALTSTLLPAITGLSAQQAMLSARIAETDSSRAAEHRALVRRFDRMDELSEALAAAEAASALSSRMLAERNEALEAAQRELVQLRHEAASLREVAARYEVMRTSRSWALTRPLRVGWRFLRGRATESDHQKLRSLLRLGVGRTPLLGKTTRSKLLAATLPVDAVDPAELPSGEFAPLIELAPQAEGVPDVFVWAVIDWRFRTQRPQHLARALAEKGHRVFYMSNNFVDNDAPGFRIDPLDGDGRLFQIHLHLTGAPAIYFDMPSADQVERLRASLAELLAWSCSLSSLSLVQHPYWTPLIRAVPNARVVYDCMDHHAGFLENAPAVLKAEQALVSDSDLVIVTSSWLEDEVGPQARSSALIRNAGEFEFFRQRPQQVFHDSGGRRVIGYYGAIADWFDVDLVRAVAEAFPDSLVLLVGDDTARAGEKLADLSNVQLTGEVPYAQLPYWLYGFDVCLLPFRVIPLTLATNPVKVYEYLAAGKPVVSVDLPELRQFGDLVHVAAGAESFVHAVGDVLRNEPNTENALLRQSFAAGQTWAHRAAALDAAIDQLREPRVSVVVLTYNNLAYTDACLFSIEAYSDYPNLEIIVVDNASTDGSRDWLADWASAPSPVGHARRLILNDANLGFSAGNNVGLRAATGDYLIILNNDTYVTPGWVRKLIAHLRVDPQLGLVGPVTNNIGNEARIDIAYADMSEMIERASMYTRANPGRLHRMDTAAFFCVAMSRTTYEHVGDMDEAFGVGFFEDDDYSRRVQEAGLRIACADDVFVHHHLSASFNALKAESKQALFERNRAIYEAKWGEWTPHKYRDG